MNTNQIKRFATEARNRLLRGVRNQLKAYFDEKGNPIVVPIAVQGGCVYGESLRDEAFYRAWMSLNKHIELYGFKCTVEEVAYTWFNRLVAINILSKNSLAEPVLQFSNPQIRVPYIVEQARSGQLPPMSAEARRAMNNLLDDPSKTLEQFTLLIDRYCASNPILRNCFGRVDDYSYLLIPNNILAEGELVDMLNSTEYISDEEYKSPELIGWLYQFYISEKKDEVFAKKSKFESDEIPAATQIFTPNWIVKYMVQNSLGRIYLDTEEYSELGAKMEYLVKGEQGGERFEWTDVKELTCADLACGSGHILNECFDLLYDIYIEQGYSRRAAIESIFAYNLVGVDIDTRAKQMAQFALLLKACSRDASFADAHAMPRVMDMPDPYPHKERLRDILPHFFLGGTPKIINETIEAISLFDHAKDLGSIMKFNLSPATREAIALRLAEFRSAGDTDVDSLFPYLDIILALTTQYAALVMNPPYMGGGNMNAVLSKYVKDNYADTKADLFAVFMDVAIDRLHSKGKYGMINMHSWMFLSSFEKLRKTIIDNQQIDNLLHLGPRTFDELSGEVVQNAAFVITKCVPKTLGKYYRLVDGKNCTEKEYLFLEQKDSGKVCYSDISQRNFQKIPGSRMGYWISENLMSKWEDGLFDDRQIIIRQGLASGDNEKFVRNWHEVEFNNFNRNATSCNDAISSNYKWFPFHKGGESRSWYGNSGNVISFDRSSYEVLLNQGNHLPSKELYFKEGLLFSRISSKRLNAKYTPAGFIFDGSAPLGIANGNLYEKIGFMCSKAITAFLEVLAPTLTFQVGDVRKAAYIEISNSVIEDTVRQNISISKSDWDAHEISWDFKRNELLSIDEETYIQNINWQIEKHFKATGEQICIDPAAPQFDSLEWCYEQYKKKWERMFTQLHENEEELNRQFIEIYGLQDELTPDVPLDEITILQQGEISIENGNVVWHDDVIARQLISYAVGCWFGRYRMDKPGLHIAHPQPTAEEVAAYEYAGATFAIDDDGIMPILPANSSFADNAYYRIKDFIRIAFGEESLIENINWIEAALGKSIEAYLMKDFWKDHKKMYQNRPIYWLFASKKGAFQCLTYMHRMDAYTAERVRSKYLLPHIEWLANEIAQLEANAGNISTAQSRTLDRLRRELDECREYHDRLHVIADHQIAFDLDDGVVVNYAKFGDILAKIK